jgi:predicted RND superfamily exporter protein
MLTTALYELEAGRSMLVGDSFSRMIVNTSLPFESSETFDFIKRITEDLESALNGEFFVLGESAVAHEMSIGFSDELNLITILTIVAFFVVTAFAFRSLSISAILVCVIQSSVFITMASVYFMGGSIMYLALIITQCLLKSRVIDYGVLYTANYIEARKVDDVKTATDKALNNSIHTIMISGLIMVTVTLVIGFLTADTNAPVSEILLLVSRGCVIGVVLSVFVLPSLTAVFDRFVHKRGKSVKIAH